MDLTNEDVADILALLDSLPYDELDLQTTRFRLTLRRAPGGWTQSTQVPTQAGVTDGEGEVGLATRIGARGPQAPYSGAGGPQAPVNDGGAGAGGGAGVAEGAERGGEAGEVGAGGDLGTGTVNRGEEADGAEGDNETKYKKGTGGGNAAEGVGQGELVAVRAPLPGTFYRAPRPGAPPFVEAGSRVRADTVVGIVETMKLMNSVHAGADGTVAEICLDNAEFAAQGATLMRIRALR